MLSGYAEGKSYNQQSLQNSQYYGIRGKPHTEGGFEVYGGFVWVNVKSPKTGLWAI